MNIELAKKNEATNENGESIMLWKFRDENGNLWNTETPIDNTEQDARQIILQSITQ